MPSNTPIQLSELIDACEFADAAESLGTGASYIERETGRIIDVHEGEVTCGGEAIDLEPEDLEDGTTYLAVPSKADFDLGSRLVFRFV